MKYQLINQINPKYSIIEQILTNRGIKREDIEHYLHTSIDDNLSPTLINNIDKGYELLMKHFKPEGKIFIQVDADCDGFTSSAVLMNYLHRWQPQLVESIICYDFHEGKDHGIKLHKVPEGTTLVIAPDSSSEDYEVHEELHNKGIDVLVIDHHHADRESEYACVINNQLDNYPTKSLSGVGMVYKFCQYLDMKRQVSDADSQIDLVALGLVADMMSLRDFETRYLITQGLSHVSNPFVSAMVAKDQFHLGKGLTPIGVAFYIAPYVNAITRVGTKEECNTLFAAMLEWVGHSEVKSTKRGAKFGDTEEVCVQAARICTNVKNRQTKVKETSATAIETIIERDNLLDKKILLIKLDKPLNKSVLGVIANELTSKYKRPVALLNKSESNGEILWAGSARGYDKSEFKNFRSFAKHSGLVEYAAGHEGAFGLGILDKHFDEFVEYIEDKLKDVTFTPSYLVDFIFKASELRPQVVFDIAGLEEYWGQDIDESLIAIERIVINKDNITLMSKDKNPTIKITLPNGITLLKFKSSEDEFNELYSDSGCVVIDVVGKSSINEYYGNITPQIFIENFTVTDRQKYYF